MISKQAVEDWWDQLMEDVFLDDEVDEFRYRRFSMAAQNRIDEAYERARRVEP